jgi:hypothetical protein
MNTPHVIFHIVDATEHTTAAVPLADNARIMFCLVAGTVFLRREPTVRSLWTAFVATEEMLAVAVVVLAQVAATTEDGLR